MPMHSYDQILQSITKYHTKYKKVFIQINIFEDTATINFQRVDRF